MMDMALDEAIKHAEEVAKENRNYAEDALRRYNLVPDKITKQDHDMCKQCAEDHEQLAEWLKDYNRLLERESYEDAISRQEVFDLCDSKDPEYKVMHLKEDVECLSSVNPQEPKTGQWIEYTRVLIPEPINEWEQAWYCSECGYGNQECEDGSAWLEWKYCPNCGAKMVEPQESEKV